MQKPGRSSSSRWRGTTWSRVLQGPPTDIPLIFCASSSPFEDWRPPINPCLETFRTFRKSLVHKTGRSPSTPRSAAPSVSAEYKCWCSSQPMTGTYTSQKIGAANTKQRGALAVATVYMLCASDQARSRTTPSPFSRHRRTPLLTPLPEKRARQTHRRMPVAELLASATLRATQTTLHCASVRTHAGFLSGHRKSSSPPLRSLQNHETRGIYAARSLPVLVALNFRSQCNNALVQREVSLYCSSLRQHLPSLQIWAVVCVYSKMA